MALFNAFKHRDTADQDTHEERQAADLPLVALLNTVLFPRMVVPLGVGRAKSLKAIEHAEAEGRGVVVVAQRDASKEDPEVADLYEVGTLATIAQIVRLPDGTAQVLVQGSGRARVKEITQVEPFLRAIVEPVTESEEKTVEIQAFMGSVVEQLEKYVEMGKQLPPEVVVAARSVEDPGWLADIVAFSPDLTFAQRQDLLETFEPLDRLRKTLAFLQKQNEVLELRTQIQSQVQEGVNKSQREYLLREQLKTIQKELGEISPEAGATDEYRGRIEAAQMPEAVQEKALKELQRLESMPMGSPEVGVIRSYLDWLVELPWSVQTQDQLDLVDAARILDEDHYGLQKVKERLLEYMAVRKLAQENLRSPILCFAGPPGVGKTSLGRSIARALGRKFVRISLGGIRDEAEIRGHRRTYIGSLPGRIIKGIRDAGTRNPVFMLDEIDKVGTDFRGDPSSALLEVLDPEQNYAFSDHYLEVPFDLSQVVFIATANILDTVPPALRDRMEVVHIAGYTEEEKLAIAQQFLVRKQLKAHGLRPENLQFTDEALLSIVRHYTKEAGVRNLERELAAICRKVARRVAEGSTDTAVVQESDLAGYLGPERFTFGLAEEEDEVGLATGVAWTETGGDTLAVEVALTDGKGELQLTGQLGDVMQESARAAFTFARSRAQQFGIDPAFFDRHNIHIHVPAGAIPKDGPSAGITIATAIISALTGRAVRRDVAMTGEITLRGRVLPIGGLKEKMLAAHRAGITTFILPLKNEKDLVDVPGHVREGMRLVKAERMEEVLAVSLAPVEVGKRRHAA